MANKWFNASEEQAAASVAHVFALNEHQKMRFKEKQVIAKQIASRIKHLRKKVSELEELVTPYKTHSVLDDNPVHAIDQLSTSLTTFMPTACAALPDTPVAQPWQEDDFGEIIELALPDLWPLAPVGLLTIKFNSGYRWSELTRSTALQSCDAHRY